MSLAFRISLRYGIAEEKPLLFQLAIRRFVVMGGLPFILEFCFNAHATRFGQPNIFNIAYGHITIHTQYIINNSTRHSCNVRFTYSMGWVQCIHVHTKYAVYNCRLCVHHTKFRGSTTLLVTVTVDESSIAGYAPNVFLMHGRYCYACTQDPSPFVRLRGVSSIDESNLQDGG